MSKNKAGNLPAEPGYEQKVKNDHRRIPENAMNGSYFPSRFREELCSFFFDGRERIVEIVGFF